MGLARWLQRLALERTSSERAKAFILSASGPFTVFFWAPTCKWCIVVANISDMRIPAENISMPQQFVLMMSGLVWSRYAFVIYPFSWNLFTVQLFMASSAVYQIGRRVHLLLAK